jgi:mRNA-degrading endonuclease RelE of RelBE toxin-antitoxin system
MAYKVSYRSSFQRDFKKLPLPFRNFILDIADHIQCGKIEGEKLKGNFRDFYKFPFGHKPEYRLIYKLYDCRIKEKSNVKCQFDDIEHTIEELQSCNGLIEFVLIKSREEMNNLYDQSKKYVKNLSR